MVSESGEVESLLAVDVGSVNTRAVLFDLAGVSYRMLAVGLASSTCLAPIKDAREGVTAAIHQIEEITGRDLLDPNHQLILPASATGTGVDNLVVSSSAGRDIRVVLVGLLQEYSLANLEKLAGELYCRVVEHFTINDLRKPEDRMNAFLQSNPDLVLLAGGTNHGASRAVLRLADQLRLWLQASQPEKRPLIAYAGNAVLNDRVKESLESLTSVFSASNILPFSGVEDINPAEDTVIQVMNRIRSTHLTGFAELEKISGLSILPTAGAESRIIRFQSLQQDSSRTVLGINVGAAASHFITANAGDLKTSVYRGLGVGAAAVETLNRVGLDSIHPWLSQDISQNTIRDYLWQKSLFPSAIPMNAETLDIEQAVARAILNVMKQEYMGLPNARFEGFEPVIASGALIAQAPTMRQSLLMMLDGLQPCGVTTLLIDRHGILSALGAAAASNPALVVQVLETGVLTNLGTVISPLFRARAGETVMRIRLQTDDDPERTFEIRKGEIVRLPLVVNKTARVIIKPLKNMDAFSGSHNLKVVGGELGLIIDTRSRPIRLPTDPGLSREVNQKWYRSLEECLS